MLTHRWLVAGQQVELSAPESMMQMLAPLFTLYTVDENREGEKCSAGIAFSITNLDEAWRLDCGGEELWRDRDGGNIIAALELALYRRLVAAVAPELCSIHAAAVADADGAVLFAGVSGAGKSSLCTRFVLNGWRYLSDEFSLLADDGLIHPFPRPLQWEHLTHPAFDHASMVQSGRFDRGEYRFIDQQGGLRTSQLWLPKLVAETAVPLSMVVLPRYLPDRPPRMESVARSQAIIELATLLQQPFALAPSIQMLHRRLPPQCSFVRLNFRDVHQIPLVLGSKIGDMTLNQ
ncbi:MAG: hypothetical protein R8J84_03905 [Mariprofundales bacterium]